jgi:hypothetical protein
VIQSAEGIIPPGDGRIVGERVIALPIWKGRSKSRGNKASRSPGSSKNEWCQTDPMKRFFACHPKAYKHPQYHKWHDAFKKANTGAK